jgi:predicted GH43/DUF377 family glycosyl hydrolase
MRNFLFFILLLAQGFALPLPDLEEMAQEFVLETTLVEIPEYPTAFNPTILRWNGSLLLCFRTRHPNTKMTHQIGMMWLDEDFNRLSAPTLLELRGEHSSYPSMEQDPRLIAVGDRIYIVYSNILEKTADKEYSSLDKNISDPMIRRVFVAELHYDGETFFITDPEPLLSYEREHKMRWEKNWVPFDYHGELMLAYSLTPHRILHPVLGTNSCETVAITEGNISWSWGVLRGGTPALKVGDQYLSFFHSSKNIATLHSQGKAIQHYFMGAYTFSAEPPFQITAISPEPIVGKHFYHGKAYKTWKPLHVVFPCGFVFDEHHFWVTYGRQDHEIWIAKIDRKQLLDSLTPIISP